MVSNNTGRVSQVIGSTLDAEFEEDKLPAIYNALKVDVEFDDADVGTKQLLVAHAGLERDWESA